MIYTFTEKNYELDDGTVIEASIKRDGDICTITLPKDVYISEAEQYEIVEYLNQMVEEQIIKDFTEGK